MSEEDEAFDEEDEAFELDLKSFSIRLTAKRIRCINFDSCVLHAFTCHAVT